MAEVHGVVVSEVANVSPPPIPLPNISAIGLIGTAPDIHIGDANTPGKFTKMDSNDKPVAGYNEPYMLTRRGDAPTRELGSTGTLPDALDAIFAQQGSCRVIIVPIEAFETGNALDLSAATYIATLPDTAKSNKSEWTLATVDGQLTLLFDTGFSDEDSAKIANIKKGQVLTLSPSTGTAKVLEAVANTVTKKTRSKAGGKWQIPVKETTTGATLSAGDYRIQAPAQDGTDKTRITATGVLGDRTGVYAMLSAKSRHGFAPRILTAAGLDTGSRPNNAANPLGAAMKAVADELRAIAYIDGPSTTHQAALDSAEDYGSDRVYFIDPNVKTSKAGKVVIRAASAFAAGLTMKTDAQYGWWTVPSNKLFNNVLGTERDIDFEMGSAACRAQLLNDKGIATIVNIGGGYRLWGDHTRATGERTTWQFLNVRRIADALYDAIAENHLWAVDKNITRNYPSAVVQGVNKLLTDLQSLEAITGGTCYPDPDLNTERNLALGVVHFVVEFTPVYPARTVKFAIELNTDRLTDLV